MKNAAGVDIPATQTTQYSMNPASEPGVMKGKTCTLYKTPKAGLNLKKGDGTDKKQYSQN